LGFEFSDLAHGHFNAKKGRCSISHYRSGKLVLQGRDAREFVEFQLEPNILGEAILGYDKIRNPRMFDPHIGLDEAGKGDFFGPLVTAAVFVNDDLANRLLDLGVKDSKRLSDARAIDLSKEIRKLVGERCGIVSIGPKRYNEMYENIGNLNTLLGWAHVKALCEVHAHALDCPRAVADQFADKKVLLRELRRQGVRIDLEQYPRGETDIAVAAASVLARAGFLQGLRRLSKDCGMELLKGASEAVKEQGKKIYLKGGIDALRNVAKAHFKTFREATGF
jgi:ribonuclease HIII